MWHDEVTSRSNGHICVYCVKENPDISVLYDL